MQNLLKASYQLVIFVHKETYETKYRLNNHLQPNSYNYLCTIPVLFHEKFTFDHPITYITLALVVVTLPLWDMDTFGVFSYPSRDEWKSTTPPTTRLLWRQLYLLKPSRIFDYLRTYTGHTQYSRKSWRYFPYRKCYILLQSRYAKQQYIFSVKDKISGTKSNAKESALLPSVFGMI